MSRHPLDPAFAKLERAETLITDLKRAVRDFVITNPYRIVPKQDDKRSEVVWSIVVEPIPVELETIAADAIHNLRTPLDKMLASGFPSANLHTEKAEISRIKFPGTAHKNELKNILSSLSAHFSPPVIDFLAETEPYDGGAGEVLSWINKLDNRDKHRSILEPIQMGFRGLGVGMVRTENGFVTRLGSRNGQHMVPVPGARPGAWHMHQPIDELKPRLGLKIPSTKTYLEFTSPHNDMEVFSTTEGARVYAQIEPMLDVAFSESGPFEGQPILTSLEVMQKAVKSTLARFSDKFF